MHRLASYEMPRFIEQVRDNDRITERSCEVLLMLDFELSTQEDVGDKIGLTAARVDQIARKARGRIAKELSNYSKRIKYIDSLESENRVLKYRILKLEKELTEAKKPIPTVEEIDAMSIEDLDMSVRLYNAIKCRKINTVGDVKEVGNECLQWRNFGKKAYAELAELMDGLNIIWPVKEKRLY